jgi:hypothetical protein
MMARSEIINAVLPIFFISNPMLPIIPPKNGKCEGNECQRITAVQLLFS